MPMQVPVSSRNVSTDIAGELRIVNPDRRYSRAKLIEPTTLGYIYVAAAVRPGRLPVVLPNPERSNLLTRVKNLAREIEELDDVVKTTVFRAIVMPPTAQFSSYLKERSTSLHVANFDVAVLIQTTSPATACKVQTTPTYGALVETIRSKAEDVRTIVARNIKRIGDVDTTRNGLFLFNHFAADDPNIMLQLWDYLAGWYAAETGLDNSVALAPNRSQGVGLRDRQLGTVGREAAATFLAPVVQAEFLEIRYGQSGC